MLRDLRGGGTTLERNTKVKKTIADGFDSANYILQPDKGRKGNMSVKEKTNIPNAGFKRRKNKEWKKTLNVFVVHCHESQT